MADVQSNIKVSIDTTDALASIKNLQRQISAFHTSMAKGGAAANIVNSQMQQTLINSINATGKFSAQMKTIRTTTESFTNSLEKNKFSLGEYFRYAGGASKSFGRLFKTEFDTINKVARENVKDLQTQYIKMGRDANGAMKAIAVRPLSLDMNDLATKTMIASEKQALLNQLLKQGSTNLLNFGKNTQWAGRQLMVGFTIPLITVGSQAAKTFMDMETQAIRFKKVYGDLFTPQAESVAALDNIKNLGKEFTKYGVAVSATVGLAADAAAAGFQGIDLQNQTIAATKLSILGQIDNQKALETTISLQNAFGTSSADLASNIDFLNAVENQTVVSLDDITTAIPKVAPVIKQLGGNVKDLAFFLTAMKEGGINASEGANALKSGLASMINPTSKASAMLEGFGINIKKIVVDNKGDLKKTVVDFATALNQLDPLNRAQAIEQMFGKFQFARLSTLFANVTKEGTQASRVLDLAGASVQDLASLSEKELGITSESAMTKFKASIENLKLSLVPVGEEFLKAVTPIAQFVSNILDKFNNLGSGTKKVIVVLTTIVAGLGPVLLMTFGLLANGIANIIKGFTAVKTLFNKTSESSATLGTEVRYMTLEERNAAAVAASLDQIHNNLAQTFTAEAKAVDLLTAAYQRSIAAQKSFIPTGTPMGRGPIKKRATGKPAVVGGTGNKDSELSLLMPGETVIPTKMSKKYGGLINGMINNSIPGYADGKGSLYGGQSLKYSGLGVFAPGNTSGNTLGMSSEFFSKGTGLTKSLMASAVGGGFTLDNPESKLTKKLTDEYFNSVKKFVPQITAALRVTAKEMQASGEDATSMEKITSKAKDKLNVIFAQMEAQGGKAASSAEALRSHLFFPGQEQMGGQFGETRVPGARYSSSKPGLIKNTMYRIKSSIFQSRVKTAYKNLYGQTPTGSYAHMNEARMLGAEVPIRGGALSLPESQKAPLLARVRAQGTRLKQDFAGNNIISRKSNAEKTAVRQSGAIYKREYIKGMESVPTKDPYLETRDRNSPHRLAAKDGKDDAVAYDTARNKQFTQSGKKRRSARRAQGPAPIGPEMPMGATQLGLVSLTAEEKRQRDKDRAKAKRQANIKKIGSKINSAGGGMGLLGANMALGMSPDFAGKGQIQSAMTGANLGMMFGPWGMAAGASIGLVTSAINVLIKKEEEHKAKFNAMFTSSATVAKMFGGQIYDTSLKVTGFNGTINSSKTSLQKLTPEMQALVDTIDKLPKNDPFKIIVDGLKGLSGNIPATTDKLTSFIATQVATGAISADKAQDLTKATLAAAGRVSDFAAVWSQVSPLVETKGIAMTTMFKNLNAEVNSESGFSKFIRGFKATIFGEVVNSYNSLGTAGTKLSNSLRDTYALAGNSSYSFKELNEITKSLAQSGLNSSKGMNLLKLSLLNSNDQEAIKRYYQLAGYIEKGGKAGKIATADFIKMNLALQLGFDPTKVKGKTPIQALLDQINSPEFKSAVDTANKALLSSIKTPDIVGNNPYVDPETIANGTKKLSSAAEAYLKILNKEIDALKAKRDAQKDSNDEIDRQLDLQNKLQDLAAQAVQAKISGNYIGAAILNQQAMQEQMKFDQQTELNKQAAIIAAKEQRAKDIEGGASLTKTETAKLSKKKIKKATGGLIKGPGSGTSDSIRASLGYAGGGSIHVSNGEYIVKAASVKDYGVSTLNAINNGTATVGTDSGGVVYNINMPITSNNANPEGVANEVMRRLKVELNKNNKSNMVIK